MKKLAIGFLLSGAAISSHAQTTAGKILLSGDMAYYANSREDSGSGNSTKQTYRQYGISPTLGYFLRDNLAVGLTGSVGRYRNEYENTTPGSYNSSNTSYAQSVGPFVRYYHMVNEKFGLYGQLAGGYQHGSDRTSDNRPNAATSRSSYNGGFGSLTPGLVFFPTEKLGLQLTLGNLGYTASKGSQKQDGFTQKSTSTIKDFNARFGLQNLAIGASFHVGG